MTAPALSADVDTDVVDLVADMLKDPVRSNRPVRCLLENAEEAQLLVVGNQADPGCRQVRVRLVLPHTNEVRTK
jgi:hypothetical protein